jgi:hypothetical protein
VGCEAGDLEIYRQIGPKQMIVCGDIRSKRFDEGDHRTDLSGVIQALVRVAEAELPSFRKPPSDIGGAFILAFMHRQTSLSLLIIEVGSYLNILRHIARTANEEIDRVGSHMVPERKPILAHAIRKRAIVVPGVDQMIAGLTPGEIRIRELDAEIGRII